MLNVINITKFLPIINFLVIIVLIIIISRKNENFNVPLGAEDLVSLDNKGNLSLMPIKNIQTELNSIVAKSNKTDATIASNNIATDALITTNKTRLDKLIETTNKNFEHTAVTLQSLGLAAALWSKNKASWGDGYIQSYSTTTGLMTHPV